MQQIIMRRISQRIGERIQSLEVEVNGKQVVVRGGAPAFT
jgi:hypothetical protein